MGVHAPIAAKPSLARIAVAVLAGDWTLLPEGGDYSTTPEETWRHECQLYLDNLADGYDEPEGLRELIAKGQAAVDYDSIAFRRARRGQDMTPFNDWYARQDGFYLTLADRCVPAMGGVS